MADDWFVRLSLVCVVGLALGFDVTKRRIPNWLVLVGLLAGVACSIWATQAAGPRLGESLLGALTGLVLLLPLYYLGAIGAGDAKLMAAIGAFLSPVQVVGAALLTFVAGGLLSLAAALWSRSLPRVLGNLRLMGMVVASGRASGMSLRDVKTTGRLPYATAIAVGTGVQVWLAAHGGWWFA